jgi:hypothetical protein
MPLRYFGILVPETITFHDQGRYQLQAVAEQV